MRRGREIYIAGKVDSDEADITEIAHDLEGRGHNIDFKWWELPQLSKPYCDYPRENSRAATQMIEAARRSEVFILNPGERILGAAVEFGAALASVSENPAKDILVINPESTRQSVFYVHPAVVAVNGLAQIRERHWY